jgi:RNA polymerase sigma factor (sigma-70 family)
MAAGGLESASDLELGQAFHDGDEAALAALYDRHLRGVYDFVARVVRDPAAAEDLTQMTFIRAWESRHKLRDPSRVKGWLFTIAHNLALNHVTRGHPTEPIDEQFDLATPAAGPEAELEAKDAAQLVWAAAASLEPRQYAVLDLSLRRDLPTPEIAEVLGVSSSHAAVLLNRAREALGNAVRYLLVARRRDHCARLAELVPARLESLTPEQRTTVDRHMRRCPECQGLAHRLTRPAELFGGLLPLQLPNSLKKERREFVLVAARRPEGAAAQPVAAWKPRGPRRDAALAGLALLLLALLGGEIYLTRSGPLTSGGHASGVAGLSRSHPGGSPSPSPAPSPSTSPSSAGSGTFNGPPGANAGSPGAVGQSALVNGSGQGVSPGGGSIRSGGGPGSTPVPTPVSTQFTPPPPVTPPFAVTSATVTANDLPAIGCDPTQFGYVCSFTVQATLRNAQNGSTVVGRLNAIARRPGGPSEAQQVPFSMTAQAGGLTASTPVQATFSFPPCQPTSVLNTGSTATAVVQQPNAVVSNTVPFGTFSPC